MRGTASNCVDCYCLRAILPKSALSSTANSHGCFVYDFSPFWLHAASYVYDAMPKPGGIHRPAVTGVPSQFAWTANDSYGVNQPTVAGTRFTGKERDGESGLDFFGARYVSSAQGRFTSPDPISGTVLHILNPQRWNMYAYAVNNPLAYTDPDGRDAIAVKFGNLAMNLGHAGVASVHHDGKGTFADFGPQHGGHAQDAGKYNFIDFKTQIQYGPDGKPTKASLSALANELADDEGQPHDSVSVAYFKTSDAETAALDAYINAAKDQQAKGKTPSYWVGFRDCIWFCQNGLAKAGVGSGSTILTIPNMQYLDFWFTADQTATGTKPKEQVTSKFCYTDDNGKQVCQ